MSEYAPNFETWFMERELTFVPKHFTVSKTPISEESRIWILENLHGRFCLLETTDDNLLDKDAYYGIFMSATFPAFEDPKEAILYELTWG